MPSSLLLVASLLIPFHPPTSCFCFPRSPSCSLLPRRLLLLSLLPLHTTLLPPSTPFKAHALTLRCLLPCPQSSLLVACTDTRTLRPRRWRSSCEGSAQAKKQAGPSRVGDSLILHVCHPPPCHEPPLRGVKHARAARAVLRRSIRSGMSCLGLYSSTGRADPSLILLLGAAGFLGGI